MSAMATMERLWDLDAEAPAREPEPAREPTLDELISGTWAQLSRHRTASCPVCGEEMTPHYGAHAMPVAARCASCASELR